MSRCTCRTGRPRGGRDPYREPECRVSVIHGLQRSRRTRPGRTWRLGRRRRRRARRRRREPRTRRRAWRRWRGPRGRRQLARRCDLRRSRVLELQSQYRGLPADPPSRAGSPFAARRPGAGSASARSNRAPCGTLSRPGGDPGLRRPSGPLSTTTSAARQRTLFRQRVRSSVSRIRRRGRPDASSCAPAASAVSCASPTGGSRRGRSWTMRGTANG